MKKILILLACTYSNLLLSQTKTNCTVTGICSDVDSGFILMQVLSSRTIDTLPISKGRFAKSYNLQEATPIAIADDQSRYHIFFAEPNSKVAIFLKRKAMQLEKLEAGASDKLFRQLTSAQEPVIQAMQQMQQSARKPGINTDSLQAVMNVLNMDVRKNFFNFLKANPNSEVSAFVVNSSIMQDRNISFNTVDTMYSFLGEKARKTYFGKETEKLFNKLKSVSVGYEAPNFSLSDSSGKKEYSLKDFRGKYVLLDFWASWCGPCKAEIPFLKKAYTAYHDKGFEIISVSLDSKADAWKAALRQFQMPWVHISDIRGFNSLVNELYYVPAIPKTLLLDKQGMIIATDLRGDALEQKLAELINK